MEVVEKTTEEQIKNTLQEQPWQRECFFKDVCEHANTPCNFKDLEEKGCGGPFLPVQENTECLSCHKQKFCYELSKAEWKCGECARDILDRRMLSAGIISKCRIQILDQLFK
ncbi:MAG: hypothetical protein ABIC36_00215 [bacterium]